MTTKNQLTTSIKRTTAVLTAVVIAFGASTGIVNAVVGGGQVQYRSIKLSDNGASGGSISSGVGSGTNVTYRVTFRAASSYNVKGVVVDFCRGVGGTPFIGDSACPSLPGFTVGTTPVVDTSSYTYGAPAVTVTGLGTTSDWTTSSLNSGQTFRMVNSSSTDVALTNGTDYTFAINGVTNTSTVGTFYARIITYTSDTGDVATYTHANVGNYQDYGGFALSTAQIVEVTAKVQETLSFCVSGTLDTVNAYPNTTLVPPDVCTSTTPPAITLGHGDNNTLDASQIDRNTVWTIASTNALNGIAIRMHNSNACGGLSTNNGTTCPIPAIGPGTPDAITAGTARFGMFCYDSDAGPLGTAPTTYAVVGSNLCNANYRDSAHTTFPSDIYFGMDNTTLDDNVTSTFGDVISASTAPVSNVRNRYDFAATASNTTPAGIYKANLAMIATGTF